MALTLNPWTAIWLRPRQTIRQIVDANPKRGVFALVAASGTLSTLSQLLSALSSPDGLPGMPAWLLFTLPFVGVFFALLGWYILGWAYRWIGSWFGGQASSEQVRAAYAWTEIPIIAGASAIIAACIAAQALGGRSDLAYAIIFLVTLPVSMVIGIWQLVMRSQALGEVHGFSGWKGFGTMFVSNMCLFMPITLLAMLAAIAIPNVLRGRMTANESAAIGNIRALSASLELYRAADGVYPGSWQALQEKDTPMSAPAFQHPDLSAEAVQGYRYAYAQRGSDNYQLTAVPAEPLSTGSRSFYKDAAGGVIRHCRVSSEGHTPLARDYPLEKQPAPCAAGAAEQDE